MNSTTLEKPIKTKSLLNKAVINSSFFSRKGILDRLFTAWFDRLVYPQIWEDPEVDIAALQLNADSHIFTISSGGCNALNYLSCHPQSITVVDLNEAHIALIQLKLAAARFLPDSQSFYAFFGYANQANNLALYQRYLQPHLDAKTRAYWEQKTGWHRKPRIALFTQGFYRFGLLGQFIGLTHWVSKRLGYDLSAVMQAKNLEEQAQLFEQHIAPVFETRLLRWLCKQPIVLYSLGIPPSQFAEMAQDSQQQQQGMHQLLKERARKLACDFPLQENYFAWQAFARQYDHVERSAVPRYLQAKHFATLQAEVNKISVFHQSMTERLAAMPNQSLNAYLLLDAQDWMDAGQLNALWQEIDRTAKPGARVVFRTAGRLSPLESKLSAELLANWQTNAEANAQWSAQDRSAIYGAVFAYQKCV
ncbi:MAG: BtaA family protein [Thiotrichales bacterium]|nr:BtaA family protein [Thiotrichales bacterium]